MNKIKTHLKENAPLYLLGIVAATGAARTIVYAQNYSKFLDEMVAVQRDWNIDARQALDAVSPEELAKYLAAITK